MTSTATVNMSHRLKGPSSCPESPTPPIIAALQSPTYCLTSPAPPSTVGVVAGVGGGAGVFHDDTAEVDNHTDDDTDDDDAFVVDLAGAESLL